MSQKIIRLLNLLAFLLDQDSPVTKHTIHSTLAEYAELSPNSFGRQFERDKNSLRELGIPLQVVDHFEDYEWQQSYRLDPDLYRSIDPQLTDPERAALLVAVENLAQAGSSPALSALFKIGGLPASSMLDPVQVELSPDAVTAVALFQAATEKRLASFRYGQDEQARTVQPQGLVHKRGRWYLTATSQGKPAQTFRLDRMSQLVVGTVPNQFEPDPEIASGSALSEQPWEIPAEDMVLARIRFQPEISWWVARRLGILPAPSGSWEVDLPTTNPEGLITWLLGLGRYARLLSPPELIERLKAHVLASKPTSGISTQEDAS